MLSLTAKLPWEFLTLGLVYAPWGLMSIFPATMFPMSQHWCLILTFLENKSWRDIVLHLKSAYFAWFRHQRIIKFLSNGLLAGIMFGGVMSIIRILLRSKEAKIGFMKRISFGGFLVVVRISRMEHPSTLRGIRSSFIYVSSFLFVFISYKDHAK